MVRQAIKVTTDEKELNILRKRLVRATRRGKYLFTFFTSSALDARFQCFKAFLAKR